MQQILTERHSGKTKQMTNWFVSTFKSKLKFFRFEIAKYKTCAFSRKFEIKPVRFRIGFHGQFHRLCSKTIDLCFQMCTIELWSIWKVWRALKKLELPSAIALGNSYASFVLSNFPACSTTRQCTLKHEPIVKAKQFRTGHAPRSKNCDLSLENVGNGQPFVSRSEVT